MRRIEPSISWARIVPEPVREGTPGFAKTRYTLRRWCWVLIGMVALTVVLVAVRRPLGDLLWPETRVQHLLGKAEQALQQGRLDSADGSGARQLYEAAQALDTDRTEAAEGLQRVAQAALHAADEALQENAFDKARLQLSLARELHVPRAQTEAVAEKLHVREAAYARIDSMLEMASQARTAGHLLNGDDAALPLYQRVIALQPTHLAALEGREDALADLLQCVHRNIAQGDLVRAATVISVVRSYDAGHMDLPEAQAALARALERRRRQATRDLERQRLESARSGYETVLELTPGDVAAQQGLERVGIAYAMKAERLVADFRFEQAEQSLVQAHALAPHAERVTQAQQAVGRARQIQLGLASNTPARERARLVRGFLDAVAKAEAEGHWLTPPGESAFDHLRAAQALAPESADVRQAAARLLPATRACFENELRSNRIRRAQACQQAWQILQPRDADLADARLRLAEKWIAIGEERLRAGDVRFAVQAMEEASRLDAQASGLDGFRERVHAAQAVPPAR